MNRKELLDTLNLAKPGLLNKEYIPIFAHFCFDGESVTAYNDIIAIQLPCAIPVKGGLKGATLLGLLNNSSADELTIEQDDESNAHIQAGSTSASLPVLDYDEFIFERPEITDSHASVVLDSSLVEGINKCLISATEDPSRPEQMGVTIAAQYKGVFLNSTDNMALSEYMLPEYADHDFESAAILPPTFCRNLVAMHKALKPEETGKLYIGDNHVLADFGGGRYLFARLVQAEALDYPEKTRAALEEVEGKSVPSVPLEFPKAVKRCLVVLSSGDHNIGKMEVASGEMALSAESPGGQVTDKIEVPDGEQPDCTMEINMAVVDRVIDHVDRMYVTPDLLILSSGPPETTSFLHLVAKSN